MTSSSDSLSDNRASAVQICSPGRLQGRRTSPTTAILTWDEPYSACHLCPDAVGYEVSGEGIAMVSVTRPPCELTGLKPDVEYSLYVYAMAAGNNRSQPSEAHIGISPGRPGNLRVRRITGTSASLSWTESPTTVPIFDYVIYCDEKFVASVRGLDYLVTGLMNASSYTFQVRARTTAGNLSDAATATPPNPPTKLEVVATTPSSVTFAWDGATDNGVTGYEISVNDTVIDTIVQNRFVVRNPAGAYFIFSVSARDAAGNFSQAATQSTPNPDREPPTRPPGMRLLSSTFNSVTLGWDASTDNVGVTGYRFFSPDGTQKDIQATSYTVNGLRTGVVYCCAVRAYDAAGNLSDVSSVDVTPSDRQAPTKPGNVRIINDAGSLTLAWDESSDNVGVAGYKVNVSDGFSDSTTATSYTFKNLQLNTRYVFGIRAFDLAGNDSDTHELAVILPHFVRLSASQVGLNPNDKVHLILSVKDEYGFPAADMDIEWTSSEGLMLEKIQGRTDASGYMLNSMTVPVDGLNYGEGLFVWAKTSTRRQVFRWFHASGLKTSDLNPGYTSGVSLGLFLYDVSGSPVVGAAVRWGSGIPGITLKTWNNITDSNGYAANQTSGAGPFLGPIGSGGGGIGPAGTVSATVNGVIYRSQRIRWQDVP